MMGENEVTRSLPARGIPGRGNKLKTIRSFLLACTPAAALLSGAFNSSAQPQRILGADISYWNCGTSTNGISSNNWITAFSSGNRKFVFIRATRGGTTGLGQTSGTPGNPTQETLSRRYDDSRFTQNLTRALNAGMLAGPYHYGRPDVSGNTGTDEADHMIQMAGAWMRPGYLMPMFDLEAGESLGGTALAQFSVAFSDRIFQVMQVRPAIYINGNYSSILQGATLTLRNALAKPATYTPSVVAPAFPMLWNARYGYGTNAQNTPGYDINLIPIQTGSPQNNGSYNGTYYGPFDDYGNTQPWSFWQFASVASIPGFNAVDTTVDSNVSHGDIEYVRNYLVPAVWWNDANGDWSTLANWNCGQTPIAPVTPPDQAPPYEPVPPLPTPRLPGAAGTGPTSGQYDTVILERTNSAITVTVSTGSHNIRKLYAREALNITGGSLTVNYDPLYRADDSPYVLHAGPFSAQFSAAVTLGGTGSLQLHTLQVDTNRTFTLSGGTLTFNTISLMPHSASPARILVSGNPALNPRADATATVANGSGSGNSGFVDLGGASKTLTIGNGASEVDLALTVPISNGGLTKSGAGTLLLSGANAYAGGTTVAAGRLLVNNTTGSGAGTGPLNVNSGAFLSGTGRISGALTVNSGGTLAPGMGAALGTFTVGVAPTFAGTNLMRINYGGSPSCDKIALTTGTLPYGGTLVVSNNGPALTGGEQFALFSAPAFSGDFTAAILPQLETNLNWYLGNLALNGTILVNRKPIAIGVTISNTPGRVLQIPIAFLIGSGSDADGHPLGLSSFDPLTANGISLTSDSTYILYRNDANVADQFSYTLADGAGGFATATAQIIPGYVPPLITADPQSQTNLAGTDASFFVAASGTSPLGYQWRFNGEPLVAAWSSSYTRTNIRSADEGNYSVVVSNIAGMVTSSVAGLTVIQPIPPSFETFSMLPGGQFHFQAKGSPGNYTIQASTNLTTWEDLTNFTTSGDTFDYSDPNTNLPGRSYRLRRD